MKYLCLHLLTAILTIIPIGALVRVEGAPPLSFQNGDNNEKDSNKNKKKGNSDKNQQKVKLSKSEQQRKEFERLLTQAKEKYTNRENLEKYDGFRLRVDEDYKDLIRRHSEYAFSVNTFDTNDERVTFTGDKLKTEDTLYDNTLVQDYVNRVGQSLVPAQSRHRYAFKVVLNPVPDSRTLSTGTVYITTGLLSVIDNEAQLAYILGHEIGHIEKVHWFEDVLVNNQLNDDNEARRKSMDYIKTGIPILGGMIGAIAGRGVGEAIGHSYISFLVSSSVLKVISNQKVLVWDAFQEDEADRTGFELMFARNYDPREVPKLFSRLRKFAEKEPRTENGFLAQVGRVGERSNFFNGLIGGVTVKPDLFRGASNLRSQREQVDGGIVSTLEPGKPFGTSDQATAREAMATSQLAEKESLLKEKLEKGEIIGSGPEFESVMADLKRDNGVRAFYYDMFQMALDNLSEALQLRSNDPYTHYYYGKALNLTARSRDEKAKAMESFVKAIELDDRRVISGPWMQRALALMSDRNPAQNDQIRNYLKTFVEVYQQEHGGELPPNMDSIYAYLKNLGDGRWVARPVVNISTRNIDPIKIITSTIPTVEPAPRAKCPEPNPQPKPPKIPRRRSATPGKAR